jgi:hypothetical protein
MVATAFSKSRRGLFCVSMGYIESYRWDGFRQSKSNPHRDYKGGQRQTV